jgi:hypothetical protein
MMIVCGGEEGGHIASAKAWRCWPAAASAAMLAGMYTCNVAAAQPPKPAARARIAPTGDAPACGGPTSPG